MRRFSQSSNARLSNLATIFLEVNTFDLQFSTSAVCFSLQDVCSLSAAAAPSAPPPKKTKVADSEEIVAASGETKVAESEESIVAASKVADSEETLASGETKVAETQVTRLL